VCFGYARDAEDSRTGAESRDTSRAVSPTHDRVLEDVTLEANPGERIAIVGASGAGKTTLLSLLPRLYDVNEGRILVDGCDVRNYSLTALRSAIAVVQQESFLFTGSVRDNIAYGRPNASDAEVREAAEIAFAHEFIERLPSGYDTLLGERGVDLSGGQRQRISIARAILRDPRVLILDEATSALDVESERSVQAALEQLMRNRTCFIIAHRLSTISSADRIVVLQGGRIVEIGTHAELLRLDSVYARLVHGQVTTPSS
jgi:ABC-type multidrug transport system fused ATPase/permease subunit